MEREKSMGDLLSFLYTVVDTLSLIFFLDAFAQRRWDNWKFTLGIGCLVALNFWILQVPLVFFGRDPAVKIGMILLSYTLSARALYREISSGMLLLLVCIEYLMTYGLASMCLAKCARVLNQNGLEYTADNIDALLLRRYESKKLLRTGKHPKGSPKRTKEQDVRFADTLEKILSKKY